MIVFAAITPHGTLAVPEAGEGAEVTQRAMAELGRRWTTAEPDATIVFTPHNVHVDDHFAVLVGSSASGSLAEWGAPALSLEVALDAQLAHACVDALRADDIPAVGVSYGSNDPALATVPLDWGALIPLWFMRGPAVVVSPARDRPLEEHVRAGAAIARATAEKRVAIVASADHGHRHDAAGPYGFDPASAEYDQRAVELIRENRLDGLLELDREFVERAAADSWWQLVMLHGALGPEWRAELLSYEAPTYYGMACAAYSKG